MNLHYARLPGAWLLLLLPLLAYSFYFLYEFRKKKLEQLATPAVIKPLLIERQGALYWIKACLYCLAWSCAVFALMGPRGNERYAGQEAHPLQTKVKGRKRADQILLLLDVSASMRAADALSGQEREAIAKEIADEIVSLLRGENVAFYAFTSSTLGIVPLTTDYLFTRMMIAQVAINEGETEGTDIRQALEEMRKNYFAFPTPVVKSLVLLSDGDDTSLEGLEEEARIAALDKIAQPLEGAKNLHLYAVGVGSRTGTQVPGVTYQGKPVLSSLQEPLLRKLASHGKGGYFDANRSTPASIAHAIVDQIEKEQTYADATEMSVPLAMPNLPIYDDYFYIPLAVAIAALALILTLPNSRQTKSS
jgi:hypothetical protein